MPSVQATFYSCDSDLRKFSASYTWLERGSKEGIFRDELNLTMVDHFIHEMIAMAHSSQRFRSIKASEEDVLGNMFIPYFRGLCTPEGLQLMDRHFDLNRNHESTKI